MDLKLNKKAEEQLRSEIAAQFRLATSRFPSEQAAAADLGMSRQRFRKYLEREMTPKADVVLLAMAKWNVKLTYQGAKL